MTDATGTRQVPERTVATDSRTASPSKSRRRLILAAGAALPSIYTLSSGAQTAVASNMACLAKGQSQTPARFTTEQDNWVRAPVDVGDYDGTPARCVSTPQSACADPATANWRSVANINEPLMQPGASMARDGSVWIVQDNRVISSSHVQITKVGAGPKQYGLVYVDQEGTVSTLDPNGKFNLSPATQSCWASVLAGRTSKLG